MPADPSRTECRCGHTVFDVSEKKSGEVLNCPWCKRQYFFWGADWIEPLDHPLAGVTAPIAQGAAKEPARPKPPRPKPKAQPAAAPKLPREPRAAGGAGREARRSRRTTPPEGIPGGVIPMVAAIAIFNTLTFVAFAYALPKLPDGTRETPFGLIPKGAIWPDIVAVLVGHLIAYFFWSLYVRLFVKRGQAPESPPSQGQAG